MKVVILVPDAMTDSIRIRIEPSKKIALTKMYQLQGKSISSAVRGFLDSELAMKGNPLDEFDAIINQVDEKLHAYGGPEPTVDDIVAYVERIREARAQDMVA